MSAAGSQLVIRPNAAQYYRYLKGVRLTAVFVLVGCAALLFEKPPVGRIVGVIFIFCIAAASLAWVYMYIKRAQVSLSNHQLVYRGLFSNRHLPMLDVAQVVLVTAYFTGGSVPLARLFILKRNGKGFTMTSLNSSFYAPEDIWALGKAVSKQSKAHLSVYETASPKGLAQAVPGIVPGYEAHPYRLAFGIIALVVVGIVVAALIAAALTD